jgi:lysophospholipase L1-like esterase
MKTKIITFVILSLSGLHLTAQPVTPFKENDRVVFLGNSITEAGYYHSYIWLYYMTRFPDMPLTIIGAGVGGDRSREMYRRLDGEILPAEPTVLVTTFGMNDSGYAEHNEPGAEDYADERVNESREWYKKMEERYKQLPDVRMVLMGSSPYDEIAVIDNSHPFGNKNKAMLRIVDFQRESAAENGWEFLDLNVPMTQISERMQQSDPSFALCGNDRIHPENDGHMVMAYLFLKAQGFVGKEVAIVDLDGATSGVKQSSNCTVSDLKKTPDGISFNYLAKALPYPVDTLARGWGHRKAQAGALKIIPFEEEMNCEILRVSGLSGRYRLLIDDEEIGVWSGESFAEGINLATISNTPQYQQALKVMFLNEERLEIERRFREYIWLQYAVFYDAGLLFANNKEAIDVLDRHLDNGWVRGRRDLYTKAMSPEIRDVWQQEMELIVAAIYKINKPVQRKIAIVKS